MQAPLKLNLPLCVVMSLMLGGCTATQSGSSIGALPTPASVEMNAPPIQLEPGNTAESENASVSTPAAEPKPFVPTVPVAVSRVILETSKGAIAIELNATAAPNTVRNFLQKVQSGAYANRIFHRVEDWVIQGGDPLGNGTGGDSMPTELSDQIFAEGSIGVARGGDVRVSNADQFFICTQECSWLTGQYTYFGKVIKGMDVAKNIAVGDKIISVTSAQNITPASR